MGEPNAEKTWENLQDGLKFQIIEEVETCTSLPINIHSAPTPPLRRVYLRPLSIHYEVMTRPPISIHYMPPPPVLRDYVRPISIHYEELAGELLAVRTKASRANVDEDDLKIHREEAVCLVCYSKCEDDNNIFKTKCRCKFSLIHEACARNWSVMKYNEQKCRLCDQKIELVPVTLSKIDPSEKKNVGPSKRNFVKGLVKHKF